MVRETIWELMEVHVEIGNFLFKLKTYKKIIKIIIFSLMMILLFFSCTKPNPKNPFDPNVDPSSWAPSNLSYTFIDINSIKLTWTDNSNSEEGFRIEIKINNNIWTQLVELPANITEYTHNNVVVPAIIEYRIYAYWGENISYAPESVTIDTSFPAPSNLSYTIIDLNSIELTWNDNSNGEDGFKIDKKIGANTWQNEFAVVGENIEEWTDNNAELEEELYYRLYAYCGNNNSDNLEINVVITFVKTFGGSSFDLAHSVQQTMDGGYIITGETESYGTGDYDFWLIKTDLVGNELWNQTYGGSSDDRAYSVQQTTDGGYIIAGYTSSYGVGGYDFWLVKTDAYGNEQWNQTYGGSSDDRAYSVQQTMDGGYIIAGYTLSYGAGSWDFWLVKTDAYGDEQWDQTYGGGSEDVAHSVQQTTDGGYIIAGHTSSYGVGNYDFWLVKTNAYGNEQWNQTYGGNVTDVAHSVQQNIDGGYIIAGYTSSYGAGGYDFWLVKTDAYGNVNLGERVNSKLYLNVERKEKTYIKKLK